MTTILSVRACYSITISASFGHGLQRGQGALRKDAAGRTIEGFGPVLERRQRSRDPRIEDFDLTACQPMSSMRSVEDLWPDMIYLIDIEPAADGSQRATCKAFPELAAFGADRKQARRTAVGALEKAISARIAHGRSLPKPATEGQIKRHKGARIKLSLMAFQKCTLYLSLRQSGLDRAELARRLGWPREAVDSLFRLDHPSRIDHIEIAFKMLQRDVGGQVARRRRAESAWTKVQIDK
jgi:antitoxin HicB